MRYLLSIALLLAALFVKGQDPHISNLQLNRTFINPAYMGIGQGLHVSTGHRQQWRNSPRNLWTSFALVDWYCDEIGIGFGGTLMNNREGEGRMNTNMFQFRTSYTLFGRTQFGLPSKRKRKKSYWIYDFATSLQFGRSTRAMDWSELIFSDQLDPVNGVIKPSAATSAEYSSFSSWNVGGGSVFRLWQDGVRQPKIALLDKWRTRKYITLGFAVNNVIPAKDSYLDIGTTLPLRWTIHGNLNTMLLPPNRRPAFFWSFHAIYQRQQFFETLLLGPSFVYKELLLFHFMHRGFIRSVDQLDGFVFSVYFKPSRPKSDVTADKGSGRDLNLTLGISADIRRGQVGLSTGTSLELSAKIDFPGACPPATSISTKRKRKREERCKMPTNPNDRMTGNPSDKQHKNLIKRMDYFREGL